ncbi:hypothetical protein N7G274_008151 [Stereocaulon virgatum]|uniref:Transferase caf17, mitochondrial n=1 Tax=Stereocaulon virgatum TaxID=373712 RepID=A0ABR3ZZI6_9LECA
MRSLWRQCQICRRLQSNCTSISRTSNDGRLSFQALSKGPQNWPRRLLSNRRVVSTSTNEDSFTSPGIINKDSTIYALSTAPGRAAIAVIRISGPLCLTIYHSLCPGKQRPKPRFATLRTLHDPGEDGGVLDSSALVFYFPAPETATGEDVLELHVHGGPAVVKAVLAAIPRSFQGLSQAIRYAEPGEFTRRAFYNDRLDLLQVEALGDTLAAETEQQRRMAVRGNTSNLTERYESWRKELLYARGELEALIDFSEDQHFDDSPAKLCASVAEQVNDLKDQLQANVQNASRGELLRNGINIALVGAPNAGKSSLLNQIAGREAAIVSSEPGTTRDVVDVNVDIGGFYCRFGDLAGLRKASQTTGSHKIGEIEQEGMRRARQRALAADVVIVVISAESVVSKESTTGTTVRGIVDDEVLEVLKQCDLQRQKIICVLNKVDTFRSHHQREDQLSKLWRHSVLRELMDASCTKLYAVSCKVAQETNSRSHDTSGIQLFLNGLTHLFRSMTAAVGSYGVEGFENNSDSCWAESLGASERQRVLLLQCLQYLEDFLAVAQPGPNGQREIPDDEDEIDVVIAAEHLRGAAACLAKITGRDETGDVEEVLGVVFEKFCVGK